MDIHTDIATVHTGYNVIMYLRSKLLRKTVDNKASDGFGWNFWRTVLIRNTKFYTLIEDYRPNKYVGNDVTSYFQSAAKCV